MITNEINRYDAIPPHIIKALTLCANGSTWADAAAAVGVKAPCLRKWYRDSRAEEFIESLVRENINVASNMLTSAAPRLADELIQIALDPKNRPMPERQQFLKRSKSCGRTFWSKTNGSSFRKFGTHSKLLRMASPLIFEYLDC